MVNAYTALNQLEPVQAMEIDGVGYLEELIQGYRTLKVDGREPLNLDLERIEIATRDGARYRRRRIDSRTLTVHFVLTADSPAEFAAKYNALKVELYKIRETRLIFDDEPDKYFVGTYSGMKVDYPGQSASVGEITIECMDPFKYAIAETVVEMETVEGQKVLSVDYQGTYPTHPVLTAVSDEHDNGFYEFSQADGTRIQIGDPSEDDKEEGTDTSEAETILSYQFDNVKTLTDDWVINDAHLVRWANDFIQVGNFGRASNYIYPSFASIHASQNYYYGPSLRHTFDAAYKNFECTFNLWFAPPSTLYGGGFDIYVNTASGRNICGLSIWKDNNADIKWSMVVNGKVVHSGVRTITNNPFAGWKTHKMRKEMDRFRLDLGNMAFGVSCPELADVEAGEISLIMYFTPNHPSVMESDNALGKVVFRAFATSWSEISNKIGQGEPVEVDTANGDIAVSGRQEPGLGAITNDFEGFTLTPGENTVVCAASDWVTDAVYTMRYREVFL